MNIYYKKKHCGWSGGIILVAAHNEEEAEQIVSDDVEYRYYLNHINSARWKKIEGARIDCDKPHIIDEDSYTE